MSFLWKTLTKFDENTNVFYFNIKLFQSIGVSVWHDGPVYKFLKLMVAILLAIFWMFKLTDFYNHLQPFVFDKFMECLSFNILHLTGLYKFLIVVRVSL